jgi:transposase
VGIRTAEALVAYIDDPARFRHNKAAGSYFGLVPCQDASAGKNRLGHITHDGPPTARRLLTQAAWQGIRRSAAIRAYFERIRHGDPDRKKIALVATMHYLARVTLAMLRTGEVWEPDVPEAQALAKAKETPAA